LIEIGVAAEVHGGHVVLGEQRKKTGAQDRCLAYARLTTQGGDARGVLGHEVVEGLRLFNPTEEKTSAVLIV
jgi:hypothetical protein